jgi:SAM-dependent methyltransferase
MKFNPGEKKMNQTAYDDLKTYYGKILKSSKDLKTNVCCSSDDSMPAPVRMILAEIDREIVDRFYGCGSPIPPLLKGCRVLDLGCGAGRDVYIISKLVGEQGHVTGVDMTSEQIETASKHIESMTLRFGYRRPNVDFRQGYIEDLKSLGIEDESIDAVTSNCVINLSPDKSAVFREIFRVLKPGGELYFSDIFAGRRVPESLKDNPVLRGECLAGAMYIEDFRRLLSNVGFPDYRVISRSSVTPGDPEIEELIGMVDFYSMTIRAFKIKELEDICEDYGQVAYYRGTMTGLARFFDLDGEHRFFTGKPVLVCGNTAAMLQSTRYGQHFTVHGDRSVHFGPFPCGPAPQGPALETGSGGSCCS